MSTSTMVTDYASDERFRKAARRGQHGVHVPRKWRDVLTPAEYTLLVVLLSMRSRGSLHVTVGQLKIAEKLGRDPEARLDQVGRITAHLVEAGVIATSRVDKGTGRTCYEFLDLHGNYDVIPWTVLRALKSGECGAGEIRTWAFLDNAMRARGWTSDTAAELAMHIGLSARTVSRHTKVLAALGVLRVQRVQAAPGLWMLERVEHVPTTATDEGSSSKQDVLDMQTVAASPAVDEGTSGEVLDTDVGSTVSSDVGSYRDLTPESVLTPEITPSSSRSARHLGDRASTATSGRKRPTGGIYSIDGINDVVDLLERDRSWLFGARRKWLNGILTQAVAPALERGLTPQAVASTLTSPSVAGDLDDANDLQQSLIPPARDGLTALAIDTRLGDACRDCGRTAFDADQAHLTRGLCDWCHEQHHPAAIPDLEEIEATLTMVSSR